jgi:hypothetical protein
MAYLVPDRKDIEALPQPLRKSEEKLVDALMNVLDDDWTVYVQPHMNGLNPDVIIFSPKHGIAIFEVKEWSLGMYKIILHDEQEKDRSPGKRQKPHYHWAVIKQNSEQEITCPYHQVERYRNAILKYEIPDMAAELVTNKSFFSLITTFVYFSGVTREYLENIPNLTDIEGKYRHGMGDDDLIPERMRDLLKEKYLYREKGVSQFSPWMQKHQTTIQNAFYPPKHGQTDLKYLNDEPTRKQKDLIPNVSGSKRRVIGSAGSGKTFVLVRKAIDAAREGKNTLLVTFNITMANYLRDLVLRLAGYYGPHVHRNVEVAHYHRLKYGTTDEMTGEAAEQRTLSSYSSKPIDVLLIDEGQDFESEWVTELLEICTEDAHAMFVEDDRQNIYVKDKVSIPQFKGRPNRLNETHRMPDHLTELANALYEYHKIDNESGIVEPLVKQNGTIRMFPTIWYNAEDYEDALETLKVDIASLWKSGRFGQPSDSAILLCQVSHGWDIDEWLTKTLPIPRNRMFESRREARILQEKYGISFQDEHELIDTNGADDREEGDSEDWDGYRHDLSQLRRKYKVLFRMRNDGLKLSTIHSFKGWELENIFILFAPDEKQYESTVPLLYTALTRSQNNVTIYNATPQLTDFGEYVLSQRLVTRWQPLG